MTQQVLKYELLNVLRNRWVVIYGIVVALLGFLFLHLSGDPAKTAVSLASVVYVLTPLTAILFTTVYWYYSDRFTELLLTQPIDRGTVFLARYISITTCLSLSSSVAILIPFTFKLSFSWGLAILLGSTVFLTAIFVTIGMLIGILLTDRMKGVGVAFAIWFYFAFVHDGLLLTTLLALRDYPLDFVSAALAAANPVGLVRVTTLMHYDASLLLGHTGALVRKLLTESTGLTIALLVGIAWISAPIVFARKKFLRRDF